jgi:transforming growth factor-beta-induced protein
MNRTCKTLALLLPLSALLACGTAPTATQTIRPSLNTARTAALAVSATPAPTPTAAETLTAPEMAAATPEPNASVAPPASTPAPPTPTTKIIVERVEVPAPAPSTTPASVFEAALARPEFSTLVSLLRAADLEGTLRTGGPFTVFAPTNDAFAKLDPALVASLTQPANKQKLAKVLRYHVLGSRLVSADIRAGKQATALGPTIDLAKTEAEVTVNGANVVAADVSADNGIVHAIDQVLLPPSIVDLAVEAPSTFSTLVTALQETNLVGALSADGPFTVFAPTNDAFAALGDALAILRKPWNRDLLAEVLKFHVLGAEKRSEALHTSVLPTLADPATPQLAVVRDGSNLTAGGQTIQTADVEGLNGVIHVLGGVMLPPGFNVPAATVVDVATSNPNFSTLASLVSAADLIDALKGDGPFTVFAPTNEAFAKLPPALVTALLQPENKAKLQQILTYHVVGSAVLARDLAAGNVNTLEGSTVAVSFPAEGASLNGSVRIVATDVRAGNGVVHAIDTVLVPPTFVAP